MSDANENVDKVDEADAVSLDEQQDVVAGGQKESETPLSEEVDEEAELPKGELTIEQQLAEAEQELGKLKDAYLRAKAEEDNVRRRAEKEVANSRKFAIEGFAKELLNVRDSLQLATAVEIGEQGDEAIEKLKEGVEITLKQLDTVFGKFSLQRITPQKGDKPDPNLHQAMSMVESTEVESGAIIEVIQDGFQLHDRLLRPALLVVAR